MISFPTPLRRGTKDVTSKNKFYVFMLFAFSPLLSLVLAIKHYEFSWAKNIVWIFIAFYAYHAIPANEGADILSYIDRFNYYRFTNYTIEQLIVSLYSEGSRTIDLIEPLLSYSLSKITDNHRILLLFYGIIYGYFYSRNVWFFLSYLNGRIKGRAIVIIVLFLVTIGIWSINGFRFWCGAHIYIYATYNFIILQRKRSLLFLVLAPLMHIGMLLPTVITFLYRFIKIPITILFPTFLFTFFLIELDLDIVRDLIYDYSPSFLQQKLTTYTSDTYAATVDEKLQNYSITFHISKYISSTIKLFFIFLLYVNRKAIDNKSIRLLFTFYLLYGIFANLLTQIPSGGRFEAIGAFILYGSVLVFLQNTKTYRMRKTLFFLYPIILLFVAYQIRIMGMYTFSLHHLFNNPILSPFIY